MNQNNKRERNPQHNSNNTNSKRSKGNEPELRVQELVIKKLKDFLITSKCHATANVSIQFGKADEHFQIGVPRTVFKLFESKLPKLSWIKVFPDVVDEIFYTYAPLPNCTQKVQKIGNNYTKFIFDSTDQKKKLKLENLPIDIRLESDIKSFEHMSTLEPGWEKQQTVSSQLFEGVCNNVVVWKIFLKTIKERDAVRTNSVTYLNEITFEFEKTLYEGDKGYEFAALRFWDIYEFCLYNVTIHLEKFKGPSGKDEESIRRLCLDKVAPEDNSRFKSNFPGSMPVTFSRRYRDVVRDNFYYISEKTDGIRYMLFITTSNVFFIGRKFDLLSFNQQIPSFAKLLEHCPNTLVDGELVEHCNPSPDPSFKGIQKYDFMVFDIMQFNSVPVIYESMSNRLKYIRDFVNICASYNFSSHSSLLPFRIIPKVFFPATECDRLIKCIKSESEEHYRYYIDGSRYHKTDGFIITPNSHYQPFSVDNLYKWKYIDLLSIDFQILLNEYDQYVFACGGSGDQLVICRTMVVSAEDEVKIKDILTARKKTSSATSESEWLRQEKVIIEFTFDAKLGMWKFHTERPDKAKPNHITVAIDTLEAITENITTPQLFEMLKAHIHKK